MSDQSTVPPGTPPPSPPPGGPTHPTPTRPFAPSSVFDLALSLGAEVARDMARPPKTKPPSKPPRKPTQTKPIRSAADVPAVCARDEGRAVGAVGAATFLLPDVRVPLVFDAGSGELGMTNPPPPPTGPGHPPPPPPPPRIGEGPLYDALPSSSSL